MSDTSPPGRMPGCFFASILLIGVPVILAFDAVFAYGLFQQCRAWGFAEAQGVVVSSKLETTQTSEGPDAHYLVVKYRYTVGGREFTGDRYRYGGFSASGQAWQRIAEQLPPGTAVAVYHDPVDPAEATLTRGPQGFDLWLGNFLVPFNLIVIGLATSRLGRRAAEGPGGPLVLSGWRAFAAAWGVVAFVGTFVLVFTAGFNPPLWAAAFPWVVGPVLGVVAGVGTAKAERTADRGNMWDSNTGEP